MSELFPEPAPPPITLQDMIEEVRLELRYRAQVFGASVRAGRMNARLAARRIDVMTAVLKHLEEERDAKRAGASGAVDELQAP
jgi:hypothetical protein